MEITRRAITDMERKLAWRIYRRRFSVFGNSIERGFTLGCLGPSALLVSICLLILLADGPTESRHRILAIVWFGCAGLMLIALAVENRRLTRIGGDAMRARIAAGQVEEIRLYLLKAISDMEWDEDYLLLLVDGRLVYFSPPGVSTNNFPTEYRTLPSQITAVRLVGDPLLLTATGTGIPLKAEACRGEAGMSAVWIKARWKQPIPDFLPFPGEWESAETDFAQYLESVASSEDSTETRIIR